jgi:hypothetical protein
LNTLEVKSVPKPPVYHPYLAGTTFSIESCP